MLEDAVCSCWVTKAEPSAPPTPLAKLPASWKLARRVRDATRENGICAVGGLAS